MTAAPASSDCIAALLDPVLPAAYRIALHLTREPADAEDVVQEAALNACRAFDSFQPGSNFRAWFFRIVTNVFLSRCRRVRRAGVAVPLDAFDAGSAVETAMLEQDDRPDPLAGFISRIDTAEIHDALADLPLEYRTVAVLYFSDDLSYQEIAAAVGCPVGTVRSRLHRSREHLKRRLAGLAAERGYGRAGLARTA